MTTFWDLLSSLFIVTTLIVRFHLDLVWDCAVIRMKLWVTAMATMTAAFGIGVNATAVMMTHQMDCGWLSILRMLFQISTTANNHGTFWLRLMRPISRGAGFSWYTPMIIYTTMCLCWRIIKKAMMMLGKTKQMIRNHTLKDWEHPALISSFKLHCQVHLLEKSSLYSTISLF